MKQRYSRLLIILQICLSYFVLLNFLIFFGFHDTPGFSLLFLVYNLLAGLSWGFNDIWILGDVFYLIYRSILYTSGVLYLVVILIKFKTVDNKISHKKFAIHFIFVLMSYLALFLAPVYASKQKQDQTMSHNQEVQRIKDNSDTFLDVKFSSSDLFQSTSQRGEITIKVSDNSAVPPEGRYYLTVMNNISEIPVLAEDIEIKDYPPYLIPESNSTDVSSPGFGEGALSTNSDSLVITFAYDDSGSAIDLNSITIDLSYLEPGPYNGENFYSKTIYIP